MFESRIGNIRSISGFHFLLDLHEQRIFRAVALQKHHVIAQTNASHADNSESHADWTEKIEQMSSFRSQSFAIEFQRGKNCLRFSSRHAPQSRRKMPALALASSIQIRIFFQKSKRLHALGFGHHRLN